jgi:hypothetical protein
MSRAALQWLTSLGTGALGVALAYIAAHTGDPATTHVVGVDPLVSFIGLTLITRLVHWLGALTGNKTNTPSSPSTFTR